MNPKTHKAAFTLIELIAVMAVMVVAFAISVPMFVQNSSDVAARQAAFDVGSTIRLAREWAIVNGVKSTFFIPDVGEPAAETAFYPSGDLVAKRRCLTSYTVYAGGTDSGQLVSTWKSLPKGLYFADTDVGSPNCPDAGTILNLDGLSWSGPSLGAELLAGLYQEVVKINYLGTSDVKVRGISFTSDGVSSASDNYILITPGMSDAEVPTGTTPPTITYFKGEPGEKGLTGCAIRVKSFTGAVDYYPFAHK